MSLTDCASLATSIGSLAVALIALRVAHVALHRSDRNASAATLVTLNDGFRQGWKRFIDANNPDTKDYEFAELMNLFEIACAIHLDDSVHGASKELLEDYLCRTLSLIGENDYAKARLIALRETHNTFKFLAAFLHAMHRMGKAHPIEGLIFSKQANA